MGNILSFSDFMNESMRFGNSTWDDISIELEENGWDVNSENARKYFDHDENGREVIISQDESYGDMLKAVVIDQETGDEIDSATINVEGISPGELESELWINLSLD